MSESPVDGWPYQRFHNWVLSLLRRGSATFPNRALAYKKAHAGRFKNPKTDRLSAHYTCASCAGIFPSSQVEADHIEPVIPVTGWESWDDTVSRLFCSVDGYQILCKDCHVLKSAEENKLRPRKKRQ